MPTPTKPFAAYLAEARIQVATDRARMQGRPEHFEGVARCLAELNRAADRCKPVMGFQREAHTGCVHLGEGIAA